MENLSKKRDLYSSIKLTVTSDLADDANNNNNSPRPLIRTKSTESPHRTPRATGTLGRSAIYTSQLHISGQSHQSSEIKSALCKMVLDMDDTSLVPISIGGEVIPFIKKSLDVLEIAHPGNKLSGILKLIEEENICRAECFSPQCPCKSYIKATTGHSCRKCAHSYKIHIPFIDRNGLWAKHISEKYVQPLVRLMPQSQEEESSITAGAQLNFNQSSAYKIMLESCQSDRDRYQLQKELDYYNLAPPEDLYNVQNLHVISSTSEVSDKPQKSIWQACTYKYALYTKFEIVGSPDTAIRTLRMIQSRHGGFGESLVLPLAVVENKLLLTEPVAPLEKKFATLIDRLWVLGEACTGLMHLHTAGIIHCDFSPAHMFRTNQNIKVAWYGSKKKEEAKLDPFASTTARNTAKGDIHSWAITACKIIWPTEFSRCEEDFFKKQIPMQESLVRLLKTTEPPAQEGDFRNFAAEDKSLRRLILDSFLDPTLNTFQLILARLNPLILDYSFTTKEAKDFWFDHFRYQRSVRAIDLITTFVWKYPHPKDERDISTSGPDQTTETKHLLWSLIGLPTNPSYNKHNTPTNIEYFGTVFEGCFGPFDSGIYSRIKTCWGTEAFLGHMDDATAYEKVDSKGFAFRVSTTLGLEANFILCLRDISGQTWQSFPFYWDIARQKFTNRKSLFEIRKLIEEFQMSTDKRKLLADWGLQEIPELLARPWIIISQSEGIYQPLTSRFVNE